MSSIVPTAATSVRWVLMTSPEWPVSSGDCSQRELVSVGAEQQISDQTDKPDIGALRGPPNSYRRMCAGILSTPARKLSCAIFPYIALFFLTPIIIIQQSEIGRIRA